MSAGVKPLSWAVVVLIWVVVLALALASPAGFMRWFVAGDGVMLGATTVVLARRVKEYRNGHREAAGDRDDPNPFALALGTFSAPVTAAEGTGSGLTETTADVPILAFKGANLSWRPHGKPIFRSLNQGVAYELDADACCNVRLMFSYYPLGQRTTLKHGDSPEIGCSCGFYAVSDVDAVNQGAALLDVELTGRVIVHERGYRAVHQRVIGVHLRGCYFCGGAPDRLSFETETYELRPTCSAHHTGQPYMTVAELGQRLDIPVDVREQAA